MNVLKNQRYLDYEKVSRYSQFPYYYNTLDDKYICGTTSYLNTSSPAVLYIVKEGDTYDSISLEAYGNPTYYWIICSYNHIQNCFDDPQPETRLYLPVISDIYFEEIV